jgi:hypothetical protein
MAVALKLGSSLTNNFSSADLVFNYSNYQSLIDDANKLKIYRNQGWNWDNRTFQGPWEKLGGTTNLLSNTTSLNVTGFSVFVLGEEGAKPGGGDNTGQPDGGGWWGTIPGIMDIAEQSLFISLYPGENMDTFVHVKNSLNQRMWVVASKIGAIENFLSFNNTIVSLNAGAENKLGLRFSVPRNASPALYTGSILMEITLENQDTTQTEIPVSLRVLQPGTSHDRLEIKVTPLKETFAPGDNLVMYVFLTNMGEFPTVTVYVQLQLLDPDSMMPISEKTENLVVTSMLSQMMSVLIPDNVPEKHYMVNATGSYVSRENTTISALGVASVLVSTSFFDRTIAGIPIWAMIVAVVVGAVSAGLTAFTYKRLIKARMSKMRYTPVLDFAELPLVGSSSASVGRLAETQKKAFINIDDLTTHAIVAGATGSGKTIAAQVIAEEALLRGKNVIVFDPTTQWTGFLRKCKERVMLKYYKKFGIDGPRNFRGRIKIVKDPLERINMKELLGEERRGKITIFVTSALEGEAYDTFVANTINEVFKSNPDESKELKTLIVYDEVHRLLPKFGGMGKGIIQLERGVREFRKWGIGIILSSQVITDFEKEIRANIRTQIQMWTRDEDELARIAERYGPDYMRSVMKAAVANGMMVNSDYNKGRPYFINFRPLLHQLSRLSDAELKEYQKYDERLEDVKFKLSKLKEKGVDIFDTEIEVKLAETKLEEGAFDMVSIYLDSVEPRIDKTCNKLHLGKLERVRERVTEEELRKAQAKAVKERREKEKKAPQKVVLKKMSKALKGAGKERAKEVRVGKKRGGSKGKVNPPKK